GALRWNTDLIHTFAEMKGMQPEQKAGSMIAALDFLHPHFARFARMSRWSILGLTVLALALIVPRVCRARRPTGSAEDPVAVPTARTAWLVAALALAVRGRAVRDH